MTAPGPVRGGRPRRRPPWRGLLHRLVTAVCVPVLTVMVPVGLYGAAVVVDLAVRLQIEADANATTVPYLADDGTVHTRLNGDWCGWWMLRGLAVGVEVRARGVRWNGTRIGLDVDAVEVGFTPRSAQGTATVPVSALRHELHGVVATFDVTSSYQGLTFTGDLGTELHDVTLLARPEVDAHGGLRLVPWSVHVGPVEVPVWAAQTDPALATLLRDLDVDTSAVPHGVQLRSASTDDGVVLVQFWVDGADLPRTARR